MNDNFEVRKVIENGKEFIEGYAIIFNQLSKICTDKDGKKYFEIINQNALNGIFDNNPNIDIVATFNHNIYEPLARLQPKTDKFSLMLNIDNKGLKFKFKIINTRLAMDVAELVSENIISQCSYWAIVNQSDIKRTEKNGYYIDEIMKISELRDVCLCKTGGYDQTYTEMLESRAKKMFNNVLTANVELEIDKLKVLYG